MDRFWDFFVDTMIALFMPLVCSYFAFTSSVFINVSVRDASGLEKLSNTLLAPVQYILAGKEAHQKEDGSWELVQRFDYKSAYWLKAGSSLFAIPPSIVLGSLTKGLSLLSSKTNARYESLIAYLESKEAKPNFELYKTLGIQLGEPHAYLTSQGHQRRPGDENTLSAEKEALRDIGRALNKAQIPRWVDCGTCLGAYRYGGVIPWDGDVDVGSPSSDFENVCHALNELDPKKYIVQDWSSRDYPNSYIKVYIRKTKTLIDIYHFAVDEAKQQLQYILSLENNFFFPEWWKIRERRFKVPAAFATVFPLKRAMLDGVEVFVPNETQKYLQRCYGENLAPAKVFDPITGNYEKDLTHPYWHRAFAH